MSSATAFCSSSVQSFASLATAAWTVAESAPAEPPPDAPPLSTPPVVPLFTVLPTRLNWLRMAPATPGPANTITRPITAMIRTYSMIDCPRRRVPLGDTPPPKVNCRCMHMRLPSLRVNRYIAERRAIPSICTGLAAAATELVGECSRRSESRCRAPFPLNSITCATCLKPFARLPKEKPARNRAGFSLTMLEDRLETPSGADA